MQRAGENSMAVETQQMSTKLRVEVVCSHTSTFMGTRRGTESAQTGQREEMSDSVNVFRRLGRRADLRDTLNKRQDQERSQ